MLLIPCPYCGPRDESEFVYGGRVIKLPAMDESDNLEDWHDAIHMRSNSTGLHPEFWYHDAGCECWIEIDRDVTTHSIAGSRPTHDAELMQVK